MTGPFAPHPGTHAVPREPSPLTLFFRRLVRPWWRKQAPEGVASGATSLIARRYPCCLHCITEDANECEPQDSHLAPCGDGCNDAAQAVTSLLADMDAGHLAGQRNAWHDSTPVPTFTPRAVTKPSAFPALSPAQQAAHADAMHDLSARYLPAAPRPVNGRNLGTQPRRQPVYGEAAQLEVEVAEYLAEEAAEADRAEYVRSQMHTAMFTRDPETLRQVLAGLEKL